MEVEWFRQLAAIRPEAARLLWRFYLVSHGEERREVAELVFLILDQVAQKGFARSVFLDPPERAACPGAYRLGSVLYPPTRVYAGFGLREAEWVRHVVLLGMTGAGKTTLAWRILAELQKQAKPFLVFDWKRTYRGLRRLALFQTLRVLTVARPEAPFRFNPLLPPVGVAPGEWLVKFIDVCKHAYFVGEGVEYLLREAITRVYEESGVFNGRGVPTLYGVRAHVAQRRLAGRMSLWKASALRVLESLCFEHGLGPVLNTAGRLDANEFFQQPVVLELDALGDSDKVFLTEAIILWLYEYRRQQGVQDRFVHATLIEEAHHVLSEKKERSVGVETIMETCLRQIREYGEAVIAIDQEPCKLSNSILANTATKIVFNLGTGEDIRKASAALNLTLEERSYINLLPIGHALVTIKNRLPHPVLVHFNPVKRN